MIAREVLEALLSPDTEQRRQAEAFLSHLTPERRCQAYLEWLSVIPRSASFAPPQDAAGTPTYEALVQLAAVLLRRTVLQVTNQDLLQQLVDPLLQAFVAGRTSRRAVGHCVAAVCQALSWTTPTASTTTNTGASVVACQRVMQVIGPRVRFGRVFHRQAATLHFRLL